MSNGIHYRAFTWDDVEPLTAMFNLAAEQDGEDGRSAVSEIEHQLRMPGSEPLVNAILAVTADGEIVGSGRVVLTPALGRAMSSGVVHPQYRGQGIGSRLLQWCSDRVIERAASEVPAEMTLYVQQVISETNTGARALMATAGFAPVRYFYTMRRDLAVPLAEPTLPPGITLRPFVPARDARAVFDTVVDTFSDHWGMGGLNYERWSHSLLADQHFDPTLWLIALDGDEIAAICLNFPWGDDLPDLGWIGTLGVRKPWRKCGLGTALLNFSFYQFQQRGWTRAGLSVDAENETRAVALYERVGMHVHRCSVVYRKVLRGDGEIRD
jgi:mycothiol synthase